MHIYMTLYVYVYSYILVHMCVCCRQLDELTYHRVADETLEELTEFFDDLAESGLTHKDFDTSFAVRAMKPLPSSSIRPFCPCITCVPDIQRLLQSCPFVCFELR